MQSANPSKHAVKSSCGDHVAGAPECSIGAVKTVPKCSLQPGAPRRNSFPNVPKPFVLFLVEQNDKTNPSPTDRTGALEVFVADAGRNARQSRRPEQPTA